MQLRPHDVHLWLIFVNEIHDKDLIGAYESLMSAEERARYVRFRFEKDRRLHLLARALVRTTLSRYAGLAPQDWRFFANQHGRPEIEASPDLPPLRFNLAHTSGIVICGVALDRDVGVDVENHGRVAKTEDIAKRYYSPLECGALWQLPPKLRRERFFHYWALKESFIKAHGLGLAMPLTQFSFHLADKAPLSISFDPRLKDDPARWQFWLLQPTPDYSMAVSLNKGAGPSANLTMRKVVPLKDDQAFTCTIIAHS